MIRGYPGRSTVVAGEILLLHIAADTPASFRICFYRQGECLVLKARTDTLRAEARAVGSPDQDWNWPVFEYPIPCNWEPGAYVAMFVLSTDAGTYDPSIPPNRDSAALFVVRSRNANSNILYKLPLFTYQAYNELGDPCGSLYTGG